MDITADLDALRVLARALVHGDPDADDLVQDTVVAALEHPPSPDRPLRPWLATVLRNRRRLVHRAAVRRTARERAVAAPELVAPAVDEMIERARMLERLAAALVALDEPFRQTIILHYLDGRSAADIARTLGVPAGTVRWRLKTGLDRLRTALDRDAPRARWQVALGTGVIVKTKTTWIGVILVVLLAAAIIGWRVRGRGTPPPQQPRPSVVSTSAPTGMVRRAADPAPAEAPPVDPLPGQGRAVVDGRGRWSSPAHRVRAGRGRRRRARPDRGPLAATGRGRETAARAGGDRGQAIGGSRWPAGRRAGRGRWRRCRRCGARRPRDRGRRRAGRPGWTVRSRASAAQRGHGCGSRSLARADRSSSRSSASRFDRRRQVLARSPSAVIDRSPWNMCVPVPDDF